MKNTTLTTVVPLEIADPSSIEDYQQVFYSSSMSEFNVISRKLVEDPQTKKMTASYQINNVKSRDQQSKQTVTTLVKSTTLQFKRLFYIKPGDENQLLYLQIDPETNKVGLMLFLMGKFQYKRLLSFPLEASNSYLFSKTSSSKKSFAVVIKPQQIAILPDLISPNWYDSLSTNLCKIDNDHAEGGLLDLCIWDGYGSKLSRLEGFESIVCLGAVKKNFDVLFSLVEKCPEPESKKWQEKIKAKVEFEMPKIQDISKQLVKYCVTSIHSGIMIQVTSVQDKNDNQYLIVDQHYLTDLVQEQQLNKVPEISSKRLVYSLEFRFNESSDLIDPRSNIFCSIAEPMEEMLQINFVHCNLEFVAKLGLRYSDGEKFFDPCGDIEYKVLNRNQPQGLSSMSPDSLLRCIFQPYTDREIHEQHLSFLQNSHPPKISTLQVPF